MYKKLWTVLLVVVTVQGLSARALTAQQQAQRDADAATASLAQSRRDADAAIAAARNMLASAAATQADLQAAADDAARANQYVIDGGQHRQLGVLADRLRHQATQRAGATQIAHINMGSSISRQLF